MACFCQGIETFACMTKDMYSQSPCKTSGDAGGDYNYSKTYVTRAYERKTSIDSSANS